MAVIQVLIAELLSVTSVLLIVITSIVFVQLKRHVQWLCRLPPGPWAIPHIFGMIFQGGPRAHKDLKKLADQYGPVFSVRIGSALQIFVADCHVIRETFKHEMFTARPTSPLHNILGDYGIVNSEGSLWKDQRKFLHETLRKFGMTYVGNGRHKMENRIMREINVLLDDLQQISEKPNNAVDLNRHFSVALSNVVLDFTSSMKFSYTDQRFDRFMDLIQEGFKLWGDCQLVTNIKTLASVPKYQKRMEKLAQHKQEMADIFQGILEEHRATFDATNPRDLMDHYLLEVKKAREAGREAALFEGREIDRHIKQIIIDLFSSGMETIKTTLMWSVVFMLRHPDKLKAVQEELDMVIGRKRLPQLDDLQDLPITDATICEVLRRSCAVPLGTTHTCYEDSQIAGFEVPKNSQVFPLIYAVHMDEKLWTDPEAFEPARFLSPEGKVKKPKYFIPFGVGRRMCLGDVMARMELFLFFASLVHRFDLRVPDGERVPSAEGTFAVTLNPESFKVCFKERKFDANNNEGLVRNYGL